MGFQLLRSLWMGYGGGWDSGTSPGVTGGCVKQAKWYGDGELSFPGLVDAHKGSSDKSIP
jgi:hypothetical protein